MFRARLFKGVTSVLALVAVGGLSSVATRAVIGAARNAKKSAAAKSSVPGKIGRIEILSQPTLTVDRLVGGKGGIDVTASARSGIRNAPRNWSGIWKSIRSTWTLQPTDPGGMLSGRIRILSKVSSSPRRRS